MLTDIHLTVPDDRDLIQWALNQVQVKSDWIFVTGGLGPTSDDLTREMISLWAKRQPVWDEESWLQLRDRLRSRGREVKDIHKSQCYFPEGARILKNAQGTAHGFHLSVYNKEVFIFPGPPNELESCWQNDMETWLLKETKGLPQYLTYSWDTQGVGESDVALMVMSVLPKEHHVEVGYRVHPPYVEVKLSYYERYKDEGDLIYQKMDQVLSSITVRRAIWPKE